MAVKHTVDHGHQDHQVAYVQGRGGGVGSRVNVDYLAVCEFDEFVTVAIYISGNTSDSIYILVLTVVERAYP